MRFIKPAQALGLTLTEIGSLLPLDRACVCNETRALAARKLLLIEQKTADLVAMWRVVDGLVQQRETDGGVAYPIIETLQRSPPHNHDNLMRIPC